MSEKRLTMQEATAHARAVLERREAERAERREAEAKANHYCCGCEDRWKADAEALYNALIEAVVGCQRPGDGGDECGGVCVVCSALNSHEALAQEVEAGGSEEA